MALRVAAFGGGLLRGLFGVLEAQWLKNRLIARHCSNFAIFFDVLKCVACAWDLGMLLMREGFAARYIRARAGRVCGRPATLFF